LPSLFPVPPLLERSGVCQSGLVAGDEDLQDIFEKSAQHNCELNWESSLRAGPAIA
jgi:hypothetical protein